MIRNKFIPLENILFIFIFLLTSCSQDQEIDNTSSLKFNEINVEQADKDGTKQFSFMTKKAIINELEKSFEAENSVVFLFQQNKRKYRLTSKGAIVTGNGEVIHLKYGVNMISTSNKDFSLNADNIIWIKSEYKGTINGNIRANIKGSKFSSQEATYNHKKNIVEFIGIKKYSYEQIKNKAKINISADNAIWYGNKNIITFTSNDKQVITKVRIF